MFYKPDLYRAATVVHTSRHSEDCLHLFGARGSHKLIFGRLFELSDVILFPQVKYLEIVYTISPLTV